MKTPDRITLVRHLAAVALGLFFAASGQPARAESFVIDETEEGYRVSEGGKPVFFYQLAPKSLEGKWKRANYLHPLHDLDGAVLTEDFPEDHRHHRGIFWAWHQLIVDGQAAGDSWVCENFDWRLLERETKTNGDGTVELETRWHWISRPGADESAEAVPLVAEDTRVTVHPATPRYRAIDFQIALRALRENVRLGGSDDVKGYGGFSTRVRLPEDLAFTGAVGEVKPDKTAVVGGAWMNLTGSLAEGGAPGGFAILQHPSLPGYPQPWMLREKKSMQNPQWPGREPVLLPTDEAFILRYRLILHRGDLTSVELDALQADYASAP